MDILNKYTIPYKGLKNGAHQFDFDLGDEFFSAFDASGINGGSCKVTIDLHKSSSMLLLNIVINGELRVDCDRCLDEIVMPVACDDQLTVKFSETEIESDGDVMWISPAEDLLQLGQYLYETIVLTLPYQRVHANLADCNQEMIEKFKIVSQNEFDNLTAPHETLEQTPQSMKLKELKDKLENKN